MFEWGNLVEFKFCYLFLNFFVLVIFIYAEIYILAFLLYFFYRHLSHIAHN